MVPCSATIIDPDQNGTRCFGEANDGSLAPHHCWLTNRKNIPATIARAIRIPTTNASSGCRAGFRPFDPAPFCAAPMPSQKGRLLIASSQANSQVAEGYGSRWLVSTAARGRHCPAHGVLCSYLAASRRAGVDFSAGRGSPWLQCKPELGARLLGGSRQPNRRCHKLDFLSKLGGSKGLAFSLPISNQAHVWRPSSAATEGLSL